MVKTFTIRSESLTNTVFEMGEVIVLGKLLLYTLECMCPDQIHRRQGGKNFKKKTSRYSNFCRRIFPEWKVHSQFITNHLNAALALDAKLSSHPIHVDCADANRINQVRSRVIHSFLRIHRSP